MKRFLINLLGGMTVLQAAEMSAMVIVQSFKDAEKRASQIVTKGLEKREKNTETQIKGLTKRIAGLESNLKSEQNEKEEIIHALSPVMRKKFISQGIIQTPF